MELRSSKELVQELEELNNWKSKHLSILNTTRLSDWRYWVHLEQRVTQHVFDYIRYHAGCLDMPFDSCSAIWDFAVMKAGLDDGFEPVIEYLDDILSLCYVVIQMNLPSKDVILRC